MSPARLPSALLLMLASWPGRAVAGEPDPSPPAASPASDDWGDDFAIPPPAAEVTPPGRWSSTVTLRTRVGVWLERLDETPLASLRTSADAGVAYSRGAWRLALSGHAEVDPAFMLQRRHFDDATYDAYATLLDLRKTHVGYAGANADVTLGWQIVPWGEAFVLGALDVTSPRDLREPGLVDLEDMRLPVLATRIGIARDNQRLELLWVHEASFGYRSPPLGPHSLYRAFLPPDIEAVAGGRPILIRDQPARYGLGAQQAFLRWMYRGPGVDLGFYLAYALDQRGVPGDFDALAAAREGVVAFPLEHRRFWMLGTSGVIPFDALLLKWELAVFPDKWISALTPRPDGPITANVQTVGIETFASLVWEPESTTQLALEWQTLFLPSGPPDAEYLLHPEVPRLALRIAHRALSERLSLELLALVGVDFGGVLDTILRAGVDYQLSDGWRVGVGAISYLLARERTGPIASLDRNDQVFLRLRWDFALE